MPPVRIAPADLASVLPPGGLTIVSGCSAESGLLNAAVHQAGPALGAMTFTGIFVSGLNRLDWRANADSRIRTFFMTPELRAVGEAVDFLPLCYSDILTLLRRHPPSAALMMVSPPDADGRCSFGATVDFLADIWREVPVRIAHINPLMPHTRGDHGIPFDDLTAWCEGDQPLPGTADEAADPATLEIARHVAAYVPDGATLQTGLGKIPGAILRALRDRRNLRVHSGLIGDGVLHLLDSGALAAEAPITAGVAIGSTRLYDAIAGPAFRFAAVSTTHDPTILAAIADLVTINSALEVDLYGQAHAELTPRGLASGPGGASDFARGARMGGGRRIIALPSVAAGGAISRIVSAGTGRGPVSLGRTDIDIVVTEHGVADLRDKGHDARAQALIMIADPRHRDALAAGWAEQCRQF